MSGNRGSIYTSYSSGTVTGKSNVGGIAGWNVMSLDWTGGSIWRCYSMSLVNGGDVVGGLVGISGSDGLSWISECYFAGSVSGDERVGGLVGTHNIGEIDKSYRDMETCGEPNMCGSEHEDCNNSYGKARSQLDQQSTFTNWDFINVWNIGENQTYPYLRTVPAGDINKDKTVNFLDVCMIAEQWCEEE